MTVSTAKSRESYRHRTIERELPHQVALPAIFCTFENYEALNAFCHERFGRRPETMTVTAIWEHGGEDDYRLYCFATAEQAREFAAHFGGILFHPKRDREGGRRRGAWRRPGGASLPIMCGPLVLPRFWRENP